MSKRLEAIAISGPTTNKNVNLNKFKFKPNDKVIHVGVPAEFDFNWIITSPKTLKSDMPFYYNWGK